MQGLNLDRNSIIAVVGVIVVVVIGSFLLSRGDDPAADDTDPLDAPPIAGENPQLDTGVDLGRVVVAENVDRDSCPIDATSTLDDSVDAFYVVAQDSDFPAGSDFFVRLYYEDQALEDSPLVAADQDYEDACVYAVFEADTRAFDPGNYEAEFIVNGNPAESVAFRIE